MSANMIHEPHSTILSDLLSSATHLRIIHFKEFDQLLRLDANLLSVMCNLPRLSEAYLYGIRGEALGAQWLKRASSPVSVLCTDAIWTSVASAGSMRTNTLTKLFLSLVDMPSMDAVFPTVHTLLLFSQACIPSALIFRAFRAVSLMIKFLEKFCRKTRLLIYCLTTGPIIECIPLSANPHRQCDAAIGDYLPAIFLSSL